MKKRSLTLFLSLTISILYYGFCSKHFFGTTIEAAANNNGSAFIGGALASAFVTPHIALGWIAVILNLVAFLANSRGCALATIILYAVSAVLFFYYALFILPEIILSIIGYIRLKKINLQNKLRQEKKANTGGALS